MIISKTKFRIRLSIIILLLAVVVLIQLKTGGASKALANLPLGSTYNELIAMAGPPDYETNGITGADPEYRKSTDQIVKGCVREAWYNSWFDTVLSSKISFCFDSKDILIHKYHWSSW